MVMVWSVGRLGRSLQDLVGFLSELHALKIDLFLRQQGLDTTTPAAGLARARDEGKASGVPRLPRRWKTESATPWRLLGGGRRTK